MRRAAAIALCLATGCAPELVDQPWRVSGPRILAVIGEPAEVRPGEQVALSAVVAASDGPPADEQALWSLCNQPKPLTTSGSANEACLGDLAPLGAPGIEAEAKIDWNACALFGPDTPPGNYRPRDPDASGGYYQPIVVKLGGKTTLGFERLQCHPASVSNEVAQDFTARYVANQNPVIGGLTAKIDGRLVTFDSVPSGTSVTLELEWPAETREPYVAVDVATQTVVELLETLQVSWFSTAGRFSNARTGPSPDEASTASDNVWIAPDEAGVVHLWAVLRDSRGGAAAIHQAAVIVR